jgi:putative ABC transport system substrate-binding protein
LGFFIVKNNNILSELQGINMNNRALLLVATLIIATSTTFYFFKKQQKSNNSLSYRIAIFEPASHPSIDEIAQGFIETMQKNNTTPYTFDRYNANGNKTLLRAQAEDIIQNNYDLIMTIGAGTTHTIYELTTKKQITTPVVFDAVADPVGLGIIASLQSSGNHVTGVGDIPSFEQQIDKLVEVKPNTKNILLVYDPIDKAGIHEIWAEQIKKIAHNKGINTHYAKVFQTNEIQTKVQPLLHNIDTILILTDHTTVSGVESLINLCNRYGITLYTSELNSGEKGAALSFGIVQYDLGAAAAKLSLEILEKNKKPTDLPIVMLTNNRLQINSATAQKQGLHLSPAQLDEFKRKEGIVL